MRKCAKSCESVLRVYGSLLKVEKVCGNVIKLGKWAKVEEVCLKLWKCEKIYLFWKLRKYEKICAESMIKCNLSRFKMLFLSTNDTQILNIEFEFVYLLTHYGTSTNIQLTHFKESGTMT